ncbi:MAG TPA: hypothetical protein VJ650_12305 [Gemmatimonadaceae bacterium]|nr:hypothetical protein [Gemmatimonadaceae bacterium]
MPRRLRRKVSHMSPAPRFRSRAFYRTVLALPVVAMVGLLATGRLQAYFRMFSLDEGISAGEMKAAWITGFIWMLATVPLLFAAWEIGRQHTAGRRFDTSWLVGLRTVVRLAIGDDMPPQILADFDRPARDDPKKALAIGGATAVFVPLFFTAVAPFLRTPAAILWLTGAGLIFGVMAYGHRRAVPYLIDEPGRWDVFRQFRLLNPARYHPAGRKFVRLQIIASVMLPFWWLGVGVWVMSRQQPN